MTRNLFRAGLGLALVAALVLLGLPLVAQSQSYPSTMARGDGELLYDSGSRECVGWSPSGAVDLRAHKHVHIIAKISAFDSSGGKTLNTQFTYSALAPDGSASLITGFVVGGTAFSAVGAKLTTWEQLGGVTQTLVASTWTNYGTSSPPYISIPAPTNSGTTGTITCQVWVFGRR